MGIQLLAKGVDAEAWAVEYNAPVRRGLEGLFFLNGSLEKLARNYAPGKPAATIMGAPVANANYGTFKGMVNYLQTQIAETESMTLFVIGKAVVVAGDVDQAPMLLGSYNVGALSGVSIYLPTDQSIRGTAGYGNDDASNINASVGFAGVTVSNWQLYSVVISPTGVSTIAHTANLSATGPNPGMPRRLAGRLLRIGSGYSTALKGVCDLAVAQIHNIAMTPEERNATVADLRAYAARRGIVV